MKIDFQRRDCRVAVTDRRIKRGQNFRRGVAAVEMALLMPLLLSLLMGLWEVGRYIIVQDILDSAAREGSRLGASGDYFSSNNQDSAITAGQTITLPSPSTNTNFELENKIKIYLQGAGINTAGMTVTVTNSGSTTNPKSWSYTWSQTGTTSGSGYDPTAAANQLDQLTVTVTLPYKNVSLSPLSWFVGQNATLTATASWCSLTDIPLTVSTTIPSQPLGAADPIP